MDKAVVEEDVWFSPLKKKTYTKKSCGYEQHSSKSYGKEKLQEKFRDLWYVGNSCYKQMKNQEKGI